MKRECLPASDPEGVRTTGRLASDLRPTDLNPMLGNKLDNVLHAGDPVSRTILVLREVAVIRRLVVPAAVDRDLPSYAELIASQSSQEAGRRRAATRASGAEWRRLPGGSRW